MKKDFIVRRSITMVEGKPHIETYSEQELVRCKDCKHRYNSMLCPVSLIADLLKNTRVFDYKVNDDWFCADGERQEGR